MKKQGIFFRKKNLGRIYEYNGLFVEAVGYLDDYPSVVNIVRYLDPDKARGRAESWSFVDRRDKIEKGYDTRGGWQTVGDADFILFISEQNTFDYANYRDLKPIRK